MTPFTAFEPGSELECSVCQFRSDAHPGCLIAAELAGDGERMTSACCPARAENRPAPAPRRLLNDMRADRGRMRRAAA